MLNGKGVARDLDFTSKIRQILPPTKNAKRTHFLTETSSKQKTYAMRNEPIPGAGL